MRNTYIYTETKKLIKKYGTRDPFEIMDQMNIVVGETSRYKTLKGYCFMSCKTIYVMISSFLSEEEKMIVAAHELGHIILHRSQLKMAPMQDDTLYNMTDNTEYQANLFAADQMCIRDRCNIQLFCGFRKVLFFCHGQKISKYSNIHIYIHLFYEKE